MNKGIKILASDYDGTLCYNGLVSKEDLCAIKKFQSVGNKFGIVTGRGTDCISVLSDLPVDFIICATGSIILNENKDVLYRNIGSFDESIDLIVRYAKKLNCTYFRYSLSYRAYNLLTAAPPCEAAFEQCNTRFDDAEDAIEFANYVNRNFSHNISAFVNGNCVDMPSSGNSKTSGILEYAKQFLNPTIYAVGDNLNDLEMISTFNGIAVSNAAVEVKNAAKYQADRIADAIEIILGSN